MFFVYLLFIFQYHLTLNVYPRLVSGFELDWVDFDRQDYDQVDFDRGWRFKVSQYVVIYRV